MASLNIFHTERVRQSRLPWIDYVRGIAIFLVLYRHIFEGIKRSGISISSYEYLEHFNIIFFSFRIPLFFIVSGVFISKSLDKRGLGMYVENKWKTILYPYLLWAFVQVSMQIMLSHYTNAERSYKDYLYILYAPREIDQFWYLYALFNTSVLYAIVRTRWGVSGKVQLFAGVCMFFLSGILVQHKIPLEFLYDILHYYVFIGLGDVLATFILNNKNDKLFSSWKLSVAILPVFVVCQYYFLQTNLAHNGYNFVENSQPALFLIIALSGCVLMVNVAFIFQKYKLFFAIRVIGYYSLYIYLLHVLASSASRVILTKIFGITNVPLLLTLGITAGLLIPIVFYNLAMSAGAWWLFGLEKKRTKTNDLKKIDLQVSSISNHGS
jgi:fucose 4-O-acetylase-like acetyltransferase